MSNYINKKLTFPNTNISIKIIKDTITSSKFTVYQCVDTDRSNINYSLKIMKISTSDKRLINSMSTEMFILVIIIINIIITKLDLA